VGNVTAVITVNEKDDGGELVEYLWGGCESLWGGLRCRDGHPQPYQTERVTIEIGNERLTAVPEIWCEDPQRGNTKGDCVQAVLTFARSAAKKAAELGPHFAKALTMVLPFTPPFDAEDGRLRTLVSEAAHAGLELQWDQHIGLSSAGLSSVYGNASYVHDPSFSRRDGHWLSWPGVMDRMGRVTQQWQENATQAGAQGIRAVVLEENGDQEWGVDIHGLRRGINHAQVLAALQRVPAPGSDGLEALASAARRRAAHQLPRPPPAQIVMSTQANCLQADGQNYYARPPDGHANSWDQGTIFYNAAGEIWGQPTFWSALMMAESHLPYVVQTTTPAADGSQAVSESESRWLPKQPQNWSVPPGLDVIALRDEEATRLTIRIVNPQPHDISAAVRFSGLAGSAPQHARRSVLTGSSLEAANTALHPHAVEPTHSTVAVTQGATEELIFPNGSFTVLQIGGDAAVRSATAEHAAAAKSVRGMDAFP